MTDEYLNSLWKAAIRTDTSKGSSADLVHLRAFAKLIERETRHSICDSLNAKASGMREHSMYPAYGLNSQVSALEDAVEVAMNTHVVKDA